MWWDEGWTLSVARNLVEHGHYGRLLSGQLAPDGMNASYTVTAPIALSFKLFGVGIWQGRLFSVLCTIGALLLMYHLARQLYNRAIAVGTLLVLLLMPMHPQLHPIIMGRQVLAEMPMLFYLLAGYTCFLMALRQSLWWLPLAILCWGIALITKAQAPPFWLASLVVPLAMTLLERRWRLAGVLGVSLVGSLAASRFVNGVWNFLIEGHTLPNDGVEGLYHVMALVLVPFNRIYALQMTLILGIPTLLGLGYAAWHLFWPHFRSRGRPDTNIDLDIVRLMLLALAGSWFAWYLLLSVGVPRYLFPATFFGSMFVAAWLYDLTNQGAISSMIQGSYVAFKQRQTVWRGVINIFIMIVGTLMIIITLITFQRYYLMDVDRSAQRVAAFFNTQTAGDSLIETHESELHFLLERSYHYPPDQLVVELNRRSLLQQDVAIDYDPLAADPDYLVVGRFSRENDLYKPVLESGAFRLLFQDSRYDVYERVR
jgi:4-amino-4-deoxy-L-arabinose transferase-like glycosyltransferase